MEINQTNYAKLVVTKNSLSLKIEAYFPVVACIYTLGLAFHLIVLLYGYLRLKKIKSTGNLQVPTIWNTVFETALEQLQLNKKIGFYLPAKVNVPLAIGFFKPVVLFPVAMATRLDIGQVEAILIHELAHIRRNGYLINLLKTCIETLLFFNPFVWLTAKLVHIEREHACDDLVVKFTGKPLTYAHALLNLDHLKGKQVPSLSLAATGKSYHLYQRDKRITNMKPNYFNIKHQFFILGLTIVTLTSLAWISPLKKDRAKENVSLTLIQPKAAKPNLLAAIVGERTKGKVHLEPYVKGNGTGTTVPNLPEEIPRFPERHSVPTNTYSSLPEKIELKNRLKSNTVAGLKLSGVLKESTENIDLYGQKCKKKAEHGYYCAKWPPD